ncbi:MAG: multicopper oxidase domain-containing protein [candidate division KSB1 bacterium]|nr:multicopper oxidase domain-containing protein [candidate division KSB1 bacterium]
MNRREFLSAGAALSAFSLLPATILAEKTKQMNATKFPQPLEPKIVGDVKEFELFIDIIQHEFAPGMRVHILAFNNQIPGPEIRVNQGDRVRVKFKNKTELNHTIHWHGLHVPWRMDGVPYVTQMPVMPGEEFVYEFVAEPYGTHFYHCHWGTLLHMQSGMFGSFIIENPDDDPIKKQFPYEREYTLVYSAHDTNFMRRELNGMLERMKERMYLMRNGRFDKERFALFDSKQELLDAIERGYQPPYSLSRRAPSDLPVPNWFSVNGKSYPSTPNLYIKEGETIRVRLINAGTEEHFLHLHGHDFWLVCDDGLPVPQPWQQNTLRLSPGKTLDIIIEGKNRGLWTFHDHDTRRVTNNGLYPGGNLLVLAYEDLPDEERMVRPMKMKMAMKPGQKMNMLPKVALDE